MNLLQQVDRLAGWWLDKRMEWAAKSNPENPEPELYNVEMSKERGVQITMSHPGIAALAGEAVNFLKAYNATNYVEMEVMPRIDQHCGPILFTVQYKNGESPAQKAKRLEAENANLRAVLEEYANPENWEGSHYYNGDQSPFQDSWMQQTENGYKRARAVLYGEQS